mgnify:CR=1 FL=1
MFLDLQIYFKTQKSIFCKIRPACHLKIVTWEKYFYENLYSGDLEGTINSNWRCMKFEISQNPPFRRDRDAPSRFAFFN